MATQDASITGLPTELIELILFNLLDPLDFCNASSTCRHLRAASERLMNEHRALQDVWEKLYFPDSDAWTIMDGMMKNPRIRYHIRRIQLGADRQLFYDTGVSDSWEISPTTHRPTEDLIDRILTVDGVDSILRNDTGPPPVPVGIRDPMLDLVDGYDDPMNSIIIRQLPNLREISFVDIGENPNFGRFIRDTVTNPDRQTDPPYLSKLEIVNLEHWDTEGGIDMSWVLDFMLLPSVKSIHGHMVDAGDESYISPLKTSQPNLPKSNITTLDFTWSCIELSALDELLSHTKNLKSFSYEHGGATVGYAEYDPRGMVAVLLKHAGHSLEVMKLETGDDYDVSVAELLHNDSAAPPRRPHNPTSKTC
jgi:hypothetical protein